jgi:hypothetical protein
MDTLEKYHIYKISNLSIRFSIVKIGLQQFLWTTDTWDIR